MAKIIHFKTKKEKDIIDFMNEVIQIIKDGNIQSIAILSNLENGDVATGYYNLSINEKQVLLGHFQMDIMMNLIAENFVTPQ